jgi:hypothetical protein
MNFRSRSQSEEWLALLLIALGVFFRIFPHPGNFTPTAAIALFAGVVLSPALAFTVPLLVMMASDLFIGLHPLFWLVWMTFMLVSWIGSFIRGKEGMLPLGLAAFGSSILFFVVSNLGVFLFERMYPRSLAGLAQCFTMALPFFRSSLLGDMFYTVVFFSSFAVARRAVSAPQKSS